MLRLPLFMLLIFWVVLVLVFVLMLVLVLLVLLAELTTVDAITPSPRFLILVGLLYVDFLEREELTLLPLTNVSSSMGFVGNCPRARAS